jgi:hypothetical protein
MENENLNKEEQEAEASPTFYIIFGLVMFLVAYFIYTFFYDLEQRGGSVRIHWLAALLYNIAGKWGIVGLFGIIGSVLIYIGAKKL